CYICVTFVLQIKTMQATADIYLDPRPKVDGTCSVKIRITHNRKRRHFLTGVDLLPDDFDKVMNNKRRTKEQREHYTTLNTQKAKADKVIKELKLFTFPAF